MVINWFRLLAQPPIPRLASRIRPRIEKRQVPRPYQGASLLPITIAARELNFRLTDGSRRARAWTFPFVQMPYTFLS